MDICFSSHTVQILSQTVQQEPTIGEFFDKSDLVLVRSSNCYLFENRWKLENDEIDSSTVRYWKDEESLLTKLNWTCLKRVKVYQLPRHEMTFFLSNLSKLSSVQHLEIDKLDLYRNSVSNYPFSSLKLLSIDAVRVVDIAGHEVAYEWAKLEITADQLNTVYLGTNVAHHVTVNSPNIIILSQNLGLDRISEILNLSRCTFQNLQAFMCNQVKYVGDDLFGNVVSGKLLPRLIKLFLNLDKLVFTAYRPPTQDVQHFARLFNHLTTNNLRPNLEIFFNHCQFDRTRKFSDYRFGMDLVSVHRHNYVINKLNVQLCPSVVSCEYLGVLRQVKKLDGESPERKFDFLKFNRLYGCIRSVIVNNEGSQVDSALFLNFLAGPKALTELHLRHSGLGKVDFYDRLTELDSLNRTLIKLSILESPLEFRKRIDFMFLSAFPCLRSFNTNVAPVKTMCDLIRLMRPGADFEMKCLHPSVRKTIHHIQFRRSNDLYEFALKISYFESQVPRRILHYSYGLEKLAILLPGLLYHAKVRHWLDDKQMF